MTQVASSVAVEPRPARTPFEQAVEAADAASTSQLPLRALWKELVSGLCKVTHAFFDNERCFLVLVAASAPYSDLRGRRLQILEDILCGDVQKSVAIDMAVAPSTIALNARLALETLGADSKPSRVHPLFMLAAKAARDGDQHRLGRLSFLIDDDKPYRVVSVPRPDAALRHVLPPAELSVLRSLVEGVSYYEIARKRGTSTRTIANQITSVFRRMHASGRNELLHRLFSYRATETSAS